MNERRPPIWPKVPAGFVRAMLAGHSALGLAFAALIYLVCLSGSLVVFAPDLERWERPQAPVIQAAPSEAVQAALREGLRRTPAAERVLISLPDPFSPRLRLATFGKDEAHKTWLMDANAKVVGEGEAPWTEFLTKLHFYLHLPETWGMFVVGLIGVALLSSLISGVASHPRVFRDAFHLRWGGSKRLQEADLHNRLGVWALPFHLTLSLTGALLGLATVIVGVLALVVFKGDTSRAYALFVAPEPPADARLAPLADLPSMMRQIASKAPYAAVRYVMIEDPGRGGQHITFGVVTKGQLAREVYSFNGAGKMLGDGGYGARNVGERLYTSLGTVHFGWYGGRLVQLAYAMLGLALTSVTSSGVAIWLARRRDKGRPAPRWERVWAATVWSQPLAYPIVAIVALVAPQAPLVVPWLAVTALAMTSTLVWTPRAISRRLRLAAAASLVGAAMTQLAVNGGAFRDPMAWVVNAGLLATAFVLAVSTRTKREAAAG